MSDGTDNDNDEPAIAPTEGSESSSADGARGARGSDDDDAGGAGDSSDLSDVILGASSGGAAAQVVEHDPVYRRTISDRTRQLFKALQPKLKEGLEAEADDDMEVAIPPPAKAPAAAAVSPPAAQPPPAATPAATQPAPAPATAATPAAAPGPDLFAGAAEPDRRVLDVELRERALTEREAAQKAALEARTAEIEERAKALEKLAQTPTRYLDRGEDEIIDLLKEWTGASSEDDVREEVAALIAGLSSKVLKIPVDPEIASKASQRRSVQKVRAYTAELERKQRDLDARLAREREADAKRREDEAKAAEERRLQEDQRLREEHATRTLGSVLAQGVDEGGVPYASKFPHLLAEENPSGIVVALVKRKLELEPNWQPNWLEVAQLAEAHYKTRNQERYKRTSHLFTPAAPAPAAPTSTPPAQHQGAPAQGRGARTLTNRDVAPVPPSPQPRQPAPLPAENPEDFDPQAYQRSHRGSSLAKLKARFEALNTTERQSGG